VRTAWIWLVLVAACGSDLGKPCAALGDCDDGVCDLTNPDGPICISRDGDLDGDGIPNDRDFCNHIPGGAFDEDRDGLGDECDPCPIAPPPARPDPDGDEVDSPCDPDPTTAGDRIVVFEGFNTGELPAGFTATANWRFVLGEAIAEPTDAGATESLTVSLPLVSQQVAVFGQHRIDRVDPEASQNLAGVVAIDERPAGGSRLQCAGTRTGMEDRLILVTDMGTGTANFQNLFDSASLYRITMLSDRADAACALNADGQQGAAQARTSGEVMNRAGLVARGVTARFQFLMVVQRGPAGGS
jgi:hypothetical protein